MWDERQEDIHKEKKMKKHPLHEKHANAESASDAWDHVQSLQWQ